MSADGLARANHQSVLRGHPRGVYLVAATEMWERFSYYGMAALLVLFLTAATTDDGFGWSNADAVRLYGVYSGLAFASPALGGWICSRYLGERRSIVVGGLCVTAGHVLMGSPAYGPWLLERASGVPIDRILESSGIVFGSFSLSAADWIAIEESMRAAGQLPVQLAAARGWLEAGYLVKSWGLLIALALVIIGTGFIKAPISSIVAKLYSRDDSRREAGFTIFMVGIWAGALGAELIAGAVGEKIGWHYGLSVAGAGMALGMTIYLCLQQRLLGEVGKLPEYGAAARDEVTRRPLRLTTEQWRRIVAIVLMSVFTMIFSIAYYQQGGALHLLVHDHVDRRIGGFEVPATWFMIVTTLSFIALAPFAAWCYARLAPRGLEPDAIQKQVLGLLSMAVAYALLSVVARSHAVAPGIPLDAGWFIAAYLFFAIGDVFIWPPQIAAVSALAPARLQSFIIGAWYVTVGSGTFLAGYVGATTDSIGFDGLTTTLLTLCLASAVALFMLRPRIRSLMTMPPAQLSDSSMAVEPRQ